VSLQDKQRQWGQKRARLQRELRVLVVDGDATTRKALEDVLFRMHVPARSVASAEHALQVAERDRYSLVVSADVLPQMHGMTLLRTLREQISALDLVLTARNPSLRLLTQAFELELLDVWDKPFDDPAALGQHAERAIRRHSDRRMRATVLDELRLLLSELVPAARDEAMKKLELRLSAYKRAIGAFDRVLVVEGQDVNLRLFSEHLMLVGLRVETSETLEAALKRAEGGAVNLLVTDAEAAPDLEGLVEQLSAEGRDIELMLVGSKPSARIAQRALRARVGCYVPWPPTSLSRLAERARELLRLGRRDRLLDNLFVELYRETAKAVGDDPDANFAAYRELIGLDRVLTADDAAPSASASASDPAEYLQDVLSGMLDDLGRTKRPTPAAPGGERRDHTRVSQSQFLRFRSPGEPSAQVAYLGDLSVGGIFVRSDEMPRRGDTVEIDFNVEHSGQHFRVQCAGVVAWLARTATDSPHGEGFGVRFVDPAPDVVELMQRIVTERDG
jgi:CheY-like chemotaxis protein/Tfp pilus assembly protein PilZ